MDMKWLKSNPQICVITLMTSVLFGAAFMLTPVFGKNGIEPEVWRLVCGGFLFGCIVICGATICRYISLRMDSVYKKSDKIVFTISFVSMIFVGCVWLLVFYPGTGLYDTIYIISSENMGVARQHPWFYCVIVKVLVKFFLRLSNDYEIAIVGLSIVQICLIAAVYSYCVTWLAKKGVPLLIWWVVYLFYLCCPILDLYMVALVKDVPFSLVLLVWVPLLYDIWESKGQCLDHGKVILKISVLFLFSLLRNNGTYISAFILLVLFFTYSKKWKAILLLGSLLCGIVILSNGVEKKLGIEHLFKETVGIPLQQIAATVYYDGEISNEDKEFINNILPLDFIKEKYNPYSADTLKWGGAPLDNKFLNSHKSAFIKTWGRLLKPNLGIYVEAYLKNTYGFWALTKSERLRYTTIYVESYKNWYQENDIRIKSLLPEYVQKPVENIFLAVAVFAGEGTIFWILIAMLLILAFFNDTKILLIGAPAVGGWLTVMISTPVAYSWRYILYMPMMLPLIFGMLFLKRTNQE